MESTGRVIQRSEAYFRNKTKHSPEFLKKLGSKWSKSGEDASLPNGWGDFCRKLY
jgi:hypothetical protein